MSSASTQLAWHLEQTCQPSAPHPEQLGEREEKEQGDSAVLLHHIPVLISVLLTGTLSTSEKADIILHNCNLLTKEASEN